MHCRTCGNEVRDDAEVCTGCGVRVLAGNQHCQGCGSETLGEAVVCVKCGVSLKGGGASSGAAGGKDKTTAGLLAIFLGGFGIHNFYLGAQGAAIVEIVCTMLFCGGTIVGFMLLTMSQADFDAKYNDRTPESMEFVFSRAK